MADVQGHDVGGSMTETSMTLVCECGQWTQTVDLEPGGTLAAMHLLADAALAHIVEAISEPPTPPTAATS